MIRSGQIILDPHGSGSFKQTIGFLLVYIYLYFRILTECQVNQTAVRQLVISTVQPIQAHAVKVMCTQQGFGQCSGAATFFGRLGTSEVPEPTPASAIGVGSGSRQKRAAPTPNTKICHFEL